MLKVSVSGYYGWLKRPRGKRAIVNDALLSKIRDIHQEYRQAYGSLKVWKELRVRGEICGKNRVARLRKINNIETRRRRRFKVTTKARASQDNAPNLINRCFSVAKPNRVWLSDVTFIATRVGWLYLAVVIDLYSRKIIGWSMSNYNNKELVLGALNMAIASRTPEALLIHHSDRGSIYASEEYVNRLKQYEMLQSMSRKGDCYDNAVVESFFSTLKNELIVGDVFETRELARMKIFEYIEVFYNRRRIHQSLGYRTPQMVEQEVLN